MLTLIKGGDIYTPDSIGRKDILITEGRIHSIADNIESKDFPVDIEVVNADRHYVVPGFIDSHVHIVGGGGEGGFSTRTPPIQLSDLTTAGVTTVVGCLGTDGITRSGGDLLAKARGLSEEGITSYIYTGSYQLPVKTLTGDIQKDLIYINEIIGIGEIAISDHRSSQPDIKDLQEAAAEARVGGILSGKAGVINVHIGDGKRQVDYLEEIVKNSEIPIKQFIPTHMNRNNELLQRALDYAYRGGLIDLTTSTTDEFIEDGETKCSRALNYFLENEIPIENISFSSDGQGSLPQFDEQGNFVGLKTGQVSSLFKEVRDAVLEENIRLETALKVITQNPARNLKLLQKGLIKEGKDADFVLLDRENLKIDTVIARGRIMVQDGSTTVLGTFE